MMDELPRPGLRSSRKQLVEEVALVPATNKMNVKALIEVHFSVSQSLPIREQQGRQYHECGYRI